MTLTFLLCCNLQVQFLEEAILKFPIISNTAILLEEAMVLMLFLMACILSPFI